MKSGLFVFCAVAVAFDSFVVGLPVLGFIACLAGTLGFGAAAIRSGLHSDKTAVFGRLRQGLVCLVGLGLILGLYRVNVHKGYSGAKQLISAVEAYKTERGNYPKALQDLTPKFIEDIPKVSLHLMWNDYFYEADPDAPVLWWIELPPFFRRFYHFKGGRWTTLD